MAILELEANLVAVAESKTRAGLRMGVNATIRRPPPAPDFSSPRVNECPNVAK